MAGEANLKIPKLVYDDIEPAAFVAACRKLMPDADPNHALNDIVLVASICGRKTPALIAGFESRDGKGWHYHVIRPRDYDGNMERIVVRADDITAV